MSGPSAQNSSVEVGFKSSYSSSSSTQGFSGTAPQVSKQARAGAEASESLDINGSNGTLTVKDIRLIVSEIELEGEADSAEFETDPTFLDLPLDTTDIAPVATSEIPPSTYNEFEFEVEDVDIDENDDDEQALQDLRSTIRNEFSNWPKGASMVAVGTFTPDGGSATSFTAYFEAEIEVEQELNPALEVTGDGLSRSLTVKLDPTRWFSKPDGTVWNLAQRDYASTSSLIEFEAEFENGITEIETDGSDDDDGSGDDD